MSQSEFERYVITDPPSTRELEEHVCAVAFSHHFSKGDPLPKEERSIASIRFRENDTTGVSPSDDTEKSLRFRVRQLLLRDLESNPERNLLGKIVGTTLDKDAPLSYVNIAMAEDPREPATVSFNAEQEEEEPFGRSASIKC